MKRTLFLLALVVAVLAAASAFFLHRRRPELRIAIIETTDSFTHARGLADLVKSQQREIRDFSAEFENGRLPTLSGVDLLIVGSFVTSDPANARTYRHAARAFRSFVETGGTLVVLCQADQDSPMEPWVEEPRELRRSDVDCESVLALQPSHPLLNAAERIGPEDLRGWRVPRALNAPATAMETFSEIDTGAPILGGRGAGASAVALVEMGWGEGRALFFAMPLDKAFSCGNEVAKRASAKLMRNVLAYAGLVERENAPPVRIAGGSGYPKPIRGTVFLDLNRNGKKDSGEPPVRGAGVSDGYDVVLSDKEGGYVLPNESRNSAFVFVSQPASCAKSDTKFFHRLGRETSAAGPFDFPLPPSSASRNSEHGVVFVQITDIHTRTEKDRDLQWAAMRQVRSLQPPPDFIVATGDLADDGTTEQLRLYAQGVAGEGVACFNVPGNHDMLGGGLGVFREYIGPDYFSFDHGGVHFIAFNRYNASQRQMAWLRRDVALLGRGKRLVVFQHQSPGQRNLRLLQSIGAQSVFSGHWHSERVEKIGGLLSVSTPPFVMAGIDASPAGFKIVRIGPDGGVETEWRCLDQCRRVTIVSPAAEETISTAGIPILVNTYNTTASPVAVGWTLAQAGAGKASGQLAKRSAWGWSGSLPPQLAAGTYELAVEVRDAAGQTWSPVKRPVRLIAGEPPSKPSPVGEWPMFMGDAAHTGSSPSGPNVPLRLAWCVETGNETDFASPILAQGRLYVALAKRGSAGSNGVMALDPADGRELWKRETPAPISHSPAFQDGVVCVVEVGGHVLGFDAATGAPRWEAALEEEEGRYSHAAPTAHKGKFYVRTQKRLARIDARTGAVERSMAIGGAKNDWISAFTSPTIRGPRLALSGMNRNGENLVVMRENDWSRLWGFRADMGLTGGLAMTENRVVFSDFDSTLHCNNLANGATVWELGTSVGSGSGWSATTPATQDGVVVARAGIRTMKALDLADRRERWSFKAKASPLQLFPYRRDRWAIFSSPTIAPGKVFFGSSDGSLYCLDLRTRELLWSRDFGVPVLSTPLVTGNALFVAAYDGRVYAFTGAR